MTVANQLHGGCDGQVAATALAGNQNASRVDVEFAGILERPMKSRDAIVQARRKRRDFFGGRRSQAVAKIDHHHGDILMGDQAPPGLIVSVETGQGHHAAAVYVVDTGQGLVRIGANRTQMNLVAVGLR